MTDSEKLALLRAAAAAVVADGCKCTSCLTLKKALEETK